jgi:hypothetical protein
VLSLSSILCAISLIACFAATRRNLSAGVIATMAIGYAYGIVRGNLQQTPSHFIYDAGAVGLYLALLTLPLSSLARCKLRPLMPWFLCLVGWPTLMFLVPTQDVLVQLVGLRANILFSPFLLIGAMMGGQDCRRLARALAILNAIVLLFGAAEVFFGVERFYAATNPVNFTIFRSNDVIYGGTTHYRIPATFVSSAAYATTMVASLPLLIGGLAEESRQTGWRYLIAVAIGIAALGVFLSGSRSAVAPLFILGLIGALPRGTRAVRRSVWLAVIVVVSAIVIEVPRMQRFTTLEDTDYVVRRIQGSINENFVTLALDYPLGNGLGGGGTSLPYFLQDRVKDPVVIENEYARLAAELGIPGLALWLMFILWLATRPSSFGPWRRGKSLARLFCLLSFATAPLGLGMLDAIPSTEMLLLLAGWFVTSEPFMSAAPVESAVASLSAAEAPLHA